MIKIRKLNFSADCYRDFAIAIHKVLVSLYQSSPWTFEQTFSDMLREETVYYIAFADNQEVVGFLATSVVMTETEITNIGVRPDFQGQGIASDLLKQLIRDGDELFLEVRASNQPALNLYQKLGFVAYYRRKSYYHNPIEDAILMKREK